MGTDGTVRPQAAFDVIDCGFLVGKMSNVEFGLHGRFPRSTLNLGVVAFYVKCNVASFRHSPFNEQWFDFEKILKRDGWTNSTLREFERTTTPFLQVAR